jgi:hypothetical protein
MSESLRKHVVTIIVAAVAAVVAAGGIVGAHNAPSDGHVRLAHRAEKTDGFKPLALRKVSSSAADADQSVARDEADEIRLFSKGPFRIYAKCYTVTGTSDLVVGEIYIRTTNGGAIFGTGDEDSSGNAFLTPATPEEERQLATTASADDPGTVNIVDGGDMPFFAAVGKFQLNGNVFVGTKEGDPAAGGGLFGSGNRRCVFGGTITWR